MSDTLSVTLPLQRWQGDRGTYHLVKIIGTDADQIAMHARLHRLEFGSQRGFGSVKVVATIGDTEWKTSVFPQEKSTEWFLLVSKKVMRAENLSEGDALSLTIAML
ncbi:MAG: DUF1905 domain-containing protein [Erythrobacter sp.]